MSTFILDPSAAETLRKCREPALLSDAAGNVVGYFRPALQPPYDPRDIPPLDEDELNRREAARDFISSAEVRRRLEKLR